MRFRLALIASTVVAAHPASAQSDSVGASAEAMQVLDDARAMLAAGTLKLQCIPSFLGSDTCKTMIERFTTLEQQQPEFADVGRCIPFVCRTALISYRRDATSKITVIISLKPTTDDPLGAYQIETIEIAESADNSD